MEPIRKVASRREGLDPMAAVHGLWRVERHQPGEERDEEQRRPPKRPKGPAAPAVHRDDEGRARVDVQA